MVQLIDKPCVTVTSNPDVYLKYQHMGGSFHGLDHYSAVVKHKVSATTNMTPSIPSTNPTNNDSSSSSDDEGDNSNMFDNDQNLATFIADEVDAASKRSSKVYDSSGAAIADLSDFDDDDDGYESYQSENKFDTKHKTNDKVGDGVDRLKSFGDFDDDSVNLDDYEISQSEKKKVDVIDHDLQETLDMLEKYRNLPKDYSTIPESQEVVVDLTQNTVKDKSADEESEEFVVDLTQRSEESDTRDTDIGITSKKLESDDNVHTDAKSADGDADDDDENFPEYPDTCVPKSRKKKAKYRRTSIDMRLFAGKKPKLLEKVPWYIDGTEFITINCTESQWVDRSKDGRWWKINTSTRKGLNGVWWIGHCKGSIMCENRQCSKLLSEGVVNTNEFS